MKQMHEYLIALQDAFENLRNTQFSQTKLFQIDELDIQEESDLITFTVKGYNDTLQREFEIHLGQDIQPFIKTIDAWKKAYQSKESRHSNLVELAELYIQINVGEALETVIEHEISDEEKDMLEIEEPDYEEMYGLNKFEDFGPEMSIEDELKELQAIKREIKEIEEELLELEALEQDFETAYKRFLGQTQPNKKKAKNINKKKRKGHQHDNYQPYQ